ncbi:hypothetical protein OQA88_8744 [Cercophora sp. LCS_1]
MTLSQCRQLCGFIEEHPDGGLCFHKKRDSTVEFHVQWLDDDDAYSSLEDLERRHFSSQSLGNMDTWCVHPMTSGEKPEAAPVNRPKVAAFKASFIRGGLVFMMHHHHYANDIPQTINVSMARSLQDDIRITGNFNRCCSPPPKSKAAELKRLATPEDGPYWISTYDVCTAHAWRVLTKHRAKLSKPDPKQTLIWVEAVECADASMTLPSLSGFKGTWYIRQLTNSSTQENMDVVLTTIASVRDKTSLFLRLDSFPPMSSFTTDWRDTRPCETNFGFTKPYAFRSPYDTVTAGLTVVYPARTNGAPAGEDEGSEFSISFELAEDLINNPEWNKYFEVRGVDAKDKW